MIPRFRAWDKTTSKLHVVNGIYCDNKKIHYIDDNRVRFVGFDNVIIMQSTGLFDRNDKEIFEGDIITNGKDVMCMKRHNTLGFYVEQKGKVEFIADCAILEEFEEDAKEIADSLEIIGNIYENKGILEEKDEKRK